MMENVVAVVLAAGKSTRMKSGKIKLLHDLCGKPVIRHLTDTFRQTGIPRIIIVVGHDRELIQEELDKRASSTANRVY